MADLIEYADAVISTWGRPRIVVGGKDVTTFPDARGHAHASVIGSMTLLDPFSYGSMTFTLVGVDIHKDRPGFGPLAFLKAGAPTVVQTKGGDNERVLHRGNVVSWRPVTNGLEVVIEGRMFYLIRQIVTPELGWVEEEDVSDFVKRIMDDVRHPQHRALIIRTGKTGILHSARGSYASPLSMITDALDKARKADGTSYTVRFGDIAPEFVQQVSRATHTMVFKQPGLEDDLLEDSTLAIHAVYGYGISPKGNAWRNAKYPNYRASKAKTYPENAGVYEVGDTLPSAVGKAFWSKMREEGNKIYSTNTTFDRRDRDNVIATQADAGIVVDGRIGAQTWTAVMAPGFDSAIGVRIIAPLVHSSTYDRFLRTADWSHAGHNPNYDGSVLPNDAVIDYGDGTRKGIALQSARGTFCRESEAPVAGTLTLTADPQEGSRLDIEAGDTFIVKNWLGRDLVLHISEVTYDLSNPSMPVTLQVSTRNGTFVTLADEATNRRAEKSGRRALNSQTTKTAGIVVDSESKDGIITEHSLAAMLGSVIAIPSNISGTYVKTRFECSTETEFIVALFNRPVTVRQAEALIGGNPFDIIDRDPWTERENELADAGLINGWGTASQPCGYGWSMKPDNGTKAAAMLRGDFREDQAVPYEVVEGTKAPFLYMVSWAKSATNLSGRFYPGPPE